MPPRCTSPSGRESCPLEEYISHLTLDSGKTFLMQGACLLHYGSDGQARMHLGNGLGASFPPSRKTQSYGLLRPTHQAQE